MVQDLDLREDLLVEVQKARILEGWRYVPVVVSQMGSFLVIVVKFLWWGYLVQIVELVVVLLMASQKESFLASLRVQHWESHSVP